jgi:hypothetical protein
MRLIKSDYYYIMFYDKKKKKGIDGYMWVVGLVGYRLVL